jgi:hypothetical protein
MCFHDEYVRYARTTVNLESVRQFAQCASMADDESVGLKLRELKQRAKVSFEKIREVANAKQRSSIQHFFSPDYRVGGYLDLEDAITLAPAFVGRGDPPVTSQDVLNLTALPHVDLDQLDRGPPLSQEVAEVLAETLGKVALGGRAPSDDVKAVLSKILRELSSYYQTEVSARSDPAETRGALRLLIQQYGRPENGS